MNFPKICLYWYDGKNNIRNSSSIMEDLSTLIGITKYPLQSMFVNDFVMGT